MKYLLFLIFVVLSASSVFSQTSRGDGIDLYRSGDYERAVEILRAVTTADKDDEIAWIYLGASLLRSGKSKEAKKAFEKGIARPNDRLPGDDSPVTILKKPRASYTELARISQTTGTVKLAVEFGADGKIGFVSIVQSVRDGLTEQSMAAAKKITFTPAMKKGKAVSTVAIVEYSFTIY